jgi:dihydroorotate dehydrogenase electron transfer subunit
MASKIKFAPQVLAPVVSNQEVMPGVRLAWLEAPEIAVLARPGQFVMVRCGDGAFLRRPLSIHRLNGGKTGLAFLFAVKGAGTEWLAGLKPGRLVDLLGPLGQGFSIKAGAGNLVLVAGGLGIAPLGFLADRALEDGKKVSLLHGAATSGLLCPDSLLPAGAACILATEDGSRGRRGYVSQCLPEVLPAADQIFACGPTPMFRTLAADASLRDKDVQVSLEVRMACGLGICYGCSVNTRQGVKQVCKHGPVFSLHDIIWKDLADI